MLVVSGFYHRETLSFAQFGDGLEPSSYPIGAVGFLKDRGFRGRIFTDSYDGGYVEYEMPQVRIAGDSYFYNWDVTSKFFSAIKDPKALREADENMHFNALLLNIENDAVVDSFWNDPDWHIAYADSHRILFLRNAEYPNTGMPKSAIRFYEGEDLKRWMNTFSVVTWIQIAFRHQDRAIAEKLVTDLASASAIPSGFIRGALLFALTQRDANLARSVLEFRKREFVTDPKDSAAIDQMAAALSR